MFVPIPGRRFECLPEEVLELVWSYLSEKDKRSVSKVSRSWRNINFWFSQKKSVPTAVEAESGFQEEVQQPLSQRPKLEKQARKLSFEDFNTKFSGELGGGFNTSQEIMTR